MPGGNNEQIPVGIPDRNLEEIFEKILGKIKRNSAINPVEISEKIPERILG